MSYNTFCPFVNSNCKPTCVFRVDAEGMPYDCAVFSAMQVIRSIMAPDSYQENLLKPITTKLNEIISNTSTDQTSSVNIERKIDIIIKHLEGGVIILWGNLYYSII